MTASGNDLLYQWSKNGEIIEGATDFHRIVTEQDFGEYWHCDAVRVTVIKDFSSLMPFTKDITVTPQ